MRKQDKVAQSIILDERAPRRLLSVVTVGAAVSPRAYVGEDGRLGAMPALALAHHEYRPNAEGCMEHYIDGVLRATVPPEGLDAYAETWPDCADLARGLKGADR